MVERVEPPAAQNVLALCECDQHEREALSSVSRSLDSVERNNTHRLQALQSIRCARRASVLFNCEATLRQKLLDAFDLSRALPVLQHM